MVRRSKVLRERIGRVRDMGADAFVEALNAARREAAQLREENERLRHLLGLDDLDRDPASHKGRGEGTLFTSADPLPSLDCHSPLSEKIRLISVLFRGREEVFAVRWENARTGKSGYSPATVDPWGKQARKSYIPMSDEVIEQHLIGAHSIGVYPLLQDHTCWFLTCDFDGDHWILDGLAFLQACQAPGVPAAIERSRSGRGGHVWLFFSEPVKAAAARRLGTFLIREAMVLRGEIDLASYDRLFPSQDFLPRKGFGNLIALPLQGSCREVGNSEFLDPSSLEPWPDQWKFLSSVGRMSAKVLEEILAPMPEVPVGSRAADWGSKSGEGYPPAPSPLHCSLGAMISIPKSGIPPWLMAQLKHLASLHNPEFFELQRLRLSTYRTPRFIRCYEEELDHLYLPRGTLDDLRQIARKAKTRLKVVDERVVLARRQFSFLGELTSAQQDAVNRVVAHDQGVLVASPGTGKTVMGCAVIAERGLPTLVLVHRQPLLDQWRSQLIVLLGLIDDEVGQISGGKHKPTGIVDVAMIQSLKSMDLETLFANYGQVVIDECHHIPAVSFEAVVKQAPLRYFLGLTATWYRRDRLEELIRMQCGPVRHDMGSGSDGKFSLDLKVRRTEFSLGTKVETSIQEVFGALVTDDSRNRFIARDVVKELDRRRRCLVLTQRRAHVEVLAELLRIEGKDPIRLDGGLNKKARQEVFEKLASQPPDNELLVVATGQYIGEGFDCPPLETLFLAFPVSFKGRVVQYVGRVMRVSEGKRRVSVYDYADLNVPVLKAMHLRRVKTYKSLGFSEGTSPEYR